MIWRVRRVLTGHDADGASTIIADGPAPNVKEMPSFPGLALTDLWETTSAPADNGGRADAAARPVRLEPPKNGTLFRIVEFPPDSSRPKDSDGAAGFKAIGAAHAQDRHSSDPMMHKTSTIDYIVVLKGEIYAVLEKGETLLKPGDVFIQRGTNHSWSVRGNEPCMVAVVLVNAKPVSGKKKAAAKKKPAAQKPAKKAKKKKSS
jgi:mannose-6-phosphate isomerase-like protein (cupin superfamily)